MLKMTQIVSMATPPAMADTEVASVAVWMRNGDLERLFRSTLTGTKH